MCIYILIWYITHMYLYIYIERERYTCFCCVSILFTLFQLVRQERGSHNVSPVTGCTYHARQFSPQWMSSSADLWCWCVDSVENLHGLWALEDDDFFCVCVFPCTESVMTLQLWSSIFAWWRTSSMHMFVHVRSIYGLTLHYHQKTALLVGSNSRPVEDWDLNIFGHVDLFNLLMKRTLIRCLNIRYCIF